MRLTFAETLTNRSLPISIHEYTPWQPTAKSPSVLAKASWVPQPESLSTNRYWVSDRCVRYYRARPNSLVLPM
jgi:hypothetical protein